MLFDFGFVIPLQAEAQPLLQKFTNKEIKKNASYVAYTGLFQNKKISLIISGCGKIKSASATQYLIDTYPAKTYIHYGTAGAISDKPKIGDIVIVTQVIEHDVVELFPKKVLPPVHTISTERLKRQLKNFHNSSLIWGSILSGDEDVITTKRKKELYKQYKGLSVDWESAGFVLTCQLNQVQGYVFRGISDYAYEHTVLEYEMNQKIAINNIISLINHLLDNGLVI